MKNTLLFLLCPFAINTTQSHAAGGPTVTGYAATDTIPGVDSTVLLDEVRIRAFEQNRDRFSGTAVVNILDNRLADRNNRMSIVNGMNSIAGVRMEERSPGSYRINMRGSSLRSPFGVRNVKVYWNDIPVTDPGGNTYFNQFAVNNFSSIEVFKGPSSSLYGAGTGGLILLNNDNNWAPGVSVDYLTGSYNLQNILATARFGSGDNRNQVSYAHNASDGYRVQSAMRRDNISWQSNLKISDRQEITAVVLYNDLWYQTPGALTAAEFAADPKAARPAGGGFPSAVNASAAIYQKNLTAGFTSRYKINELFNHMVSLYGAYSQVKNSAIRNYERRSEPQFGGRTTFTYRKVKDASALTLNAGAELQQGYFNTQVSNNRAGRPDTLQTNDDIDNRAVVLFAQADLVLQESWFITGGLSFNKNIIGFNRLSRYPVLQQKTSFNNEIAPRIAVMKHISADFHVLGSVARGFSPPTVAELLPSTGVISTELEAEHGWNYELTARYFLLGRSLRVEATGFYFDLKDALVQRRDVSGADFFTNAGNVKQKGLELQADYTWYPAVRSVVDRLQLGSAFTYAHFRYGSFVKGSDDFSGKTIPSVPREAFSLLADLRLVNGIYVNATLYTASKIYLNDANTAAADGYELLGARIGWKKSGKWFELDIYGGADNLFDQRYSLGNDINAAANRFYNAAPRRNYYVGVGLGWNKTPKSAG